MSKFIQYNICCKKIYISSAIIVSKKNIYKRIVSYRKIEIF